MNLIDYPLLVPPENLAGKGRENWTAGEAAAYKDWLLAVLTERLREMTERLDEPIKVPPSAHLQSLGTKIAGIIDKDSFSEQCPTGRRLSNRGHALAADIGLLVAHYLLKAHPNKLNWQIMRKRREMSYNLPVIVGFSSNYLDPIGGSIAEGTAILRGERGPDAWKRIYEFWVNKVDG